MSVSQKKQCLTFRGFQDTIFLHTFPDISFLRVPTGGRQLPNGTSLKKKSSTCAREQALFDPRGGRLTSHELKINPKGFICLWPSHILATVSLEIFHMSLAQTCGNMPLSLLVPWSYSRTHTTSALTSLLKSTY